MSDLLTYDASFEVGCTLRYYLPESCTFVVTVAADDGPGQRVRQETLELSPYRESTWLRMPESGNRCARFVAAPGELQIAYRARAETSPQLLAPDATGIGLVADLPSRVLPYLWPSRFCHSDELLDFAAGKFGHLPAGYPQVAAACEWVRANIRYEPDSSNARTSVLETLSVGAGVCRDFAHLTITLCRALNYPARFVSAYACGLPWQDFHALIEVWLGDRWYLFDPTGHAHLPAVVRIATGRDAADAAFAWILGPAEMTGMEVFIRPTDAGGMPAGRSDLAVCSSPGWQATGL